MKTKRVLLVFAAALIAATGIKTGAQEAKPAAARSLAAESAGTDPPAPPIKKKPVRVDGAQAYKSNCLRCHVEPKKFSERAMVTVVRHMRVRANLTEAETQAILSYLTK